MSDIDSIGTVRRLRALCAAGYTQKDLAKRLAVNEFWLLAMIEGDSDTVDADSAARISALFNQIQLIPGRSAEARQAARARLWASPLAWDEDEIDNPAAKPHLGRQKALQFPERYAEMRELGYKDVEILRRWKIQAESLVRQLNRYGITPSPELITLAAERKYQRAKEAS
jgi:hypothetical protein